MYAGTVSDVYWHVRKTKNNLTYYSGTAEPVPRRGSRFAVRISGACSKRQMKKKHTHTIYYNFRSTCNSKNTIKFTRSNKHICVFKLKTRIPFLPNLFHLVVFTWTLETHRTRKVLAERTRIINVNKRTIIYDRRRVKTSVYYMVKIKKIKFISNNIIGCIV